MNVIQFYTSTNDNNESVKQNSFFDVLYVIKKIGNIKILMGDLNANEWLHNRIQGEQGTTGTYGNEWNG